MGTIGDRGARAILAALASVVVAAACTSGPRASSPASSARPARPVASTAQPSPSAVPVRDCQSSVFGHLGSDWRSHATMLGPIAFVGLPGYATAPARWFRAKPGHVASAKVLVVLRDGHRVTLAIPARFRSVLRLDYAPITTAPVSVQDGQIGVTLASCRAGESPYGDHPATQFNGGFLMTGPLCAVLDVSIDGRAPERLPLSFGRGVGCRPG